MLFYAESLGECMTQLDKNIALNLKRIRKSKNMSLDMLAERTGVSKSMLGQNRTGKNQSHGVHYRKNRGGFEGAFRAADL